MFVFSMSVQPVFLQFNMKIQPSGTCVIVTKPSHIIRSNSANFSLKKMCPEILTTTSSQNNLLKPPTPNLRFISHHSSSCEEWYDDVKVLRRQDAVDQLSECASESDSGVVQSVEVDDICGCNIESVNTCLNCSGRPQINPSSDAAEPQNAEVHASPASEGKSQKKEKKARRIRMRCGKKCVVS